MQEHALNPATKTAIEKMHAYFRACQRDAPRQEKEKLEREWLNAVRRLRN